MTFTHSLPCLSNYLFDDSGRCRNVKTGRAISCCELPGNYYQKYSLVDDSGRQQSVRLAEVVQYIGHLKQVERLKDDPLKFEILSKDIDHYPRSKPLTDEELNKLINAA